VHTQVCKLWGCSLALPAAARTLVTALENTALMFEARLRARISELLRPRLGEYRCTREIAVCAHALTLVVLN
jgi:hypothetical protein